MSTYDDMMSTRPDNPFEDEEYRAMAEKRQREWDSNEGLLHELNLDEPATGRGHYILVCEHLKSHGINPDDADAEQLLAALKAVA
jgi:hypothetical protein